jgi:hypothetical protein
MSRRKIVAGTASNLIPVFVRDTSKTDGSGLSVAYNASGLTAEYRRKGSSSWTSISVVTKTLGVFTSGGWCADGSLTGAHEFAPPDAAFAAGATSVALRVYGVTNMLPVLLEFELMTFNDQAAGGKVPVAAKGLAISNFGFIMRSSTSKAPTPGLTVTAQRSLDGAAFGACDNSPSGIGSGAYSINLSTADTNANVAMYMFTATGADPTFVEMLFQ